MLSIATRKPYHTDGKTSQQGINKAGRQKPLQNALESTII